MVNNCLDYGVYACYGVVFTHFNHFSPLKRHRAHIKLTYKMENFNLLLGEIGGYG